MHSPLANSVNSRLSSRAGGVTSVTVRVENRMSAEVNGQVDK
jgi:hypothetical protein